MKDDLAVSPVDAPATRTAFEAHMRSRNPCVRLARQQEYLGGHYRTVTVQRAWELWLAALASNHHAPSGNG
jgi:hypothetical protein